MDRAIQTALWMTLSAAGTAAACVESSTYSKLLHDYAVAVNEVRLQHGLPPLKLNRQLCAAAQAHAETLLRTGQICHADTHGQRADYRATQAGYFYWRLGENLAAGQLSWERALEMWLRSPTHRANLLDADYRELGVGFSTDESTRYRTAWTQLLGARRHVYPVIVNLDALIAETPDVRVYVHGTAQAQAIRYRIGDGAWSEWQRPRAWLHLRLPDREGWYTITVQVRHGERVYEADDDIYLQPASRLVEVAGNSKPDNQCRARLTQCISTGIQRAPSSKHIVQQPHHTPPYRFRMHYLERMPHILQPLSATQPHLRTTVEPTTQPLRLHRDS